MSFVSSSLYFQEVINFLETYRWVYDFQVTHLFNNEIWHHFPLEWLNYLTSVSYEDLNAIIDGMTVAVPTSLARFTDTANKLSLSRDVALDSSDANINNALRKGMNEKKCHEVARLAGVVNSVMMKCNASPVIVDVGAGLGYLGQVMNACYGTKVISLECEATKAHGSKQRLNKNDLDTNNFRTVTCNISDTNESREELKCIIDDFLEQNTQRTLTSSELQSFGVDSDGCPVDVRNTSKSDENQTKEYNLKLTNLVSRDSSGSSRRDLSTKFKSDPIKVDSHPTSLLNPVHTRPCEKRDYSERGGNSRDKTAKPEVPMNLSPVSRVVMVGLHCCGDLTPATLRHFVHLDRVAAICCVSCCYHRMAFSLEKPINFPMSGACRGAMTGHWSLSRYALRLAAQETWARWKVQTPLDHECHTKHVAYRSLLDLYLKREGLEAHKMRRKLVRKSQYNSFDEYISVAWANLSFTSHNIELEEMREKMWGLYHEYEPHFNIIQPITALQTILQPVIESLICSDRLLYIRESISAVDANIRAVFDDHRSPRNLALIATKPYDVGCGWS